MMKTEKIKILMVLGMTLCVSSHALATVVMNGNPMQQVVATVPAVPQQQQPASVKAPAPVWNTPGAATNIKISGPFGSGCIFSPPLTQELKDRVTQLSEKVKAIDGTASDAGKKLEEAAIEALQLLADMLRQQGSQLVINLSELGQ